LNNIEGKKKLDEEKKQVNENKHNLEKNIIKYLKLSEKKRELDIQVNELKEIENAAKAKLEIEKDDLKEEDNTLLEISQTRLLGVLNSRLENEK